MCPFENYFLGFRQRLQKSNVSRKEAQNKYETGETIAKCSKEQVEFFVHVEFQFFLHLKANYKR